MPVFLNPLVLFRLLCFILSVLAATNIPQQEVLTMKAANTSFLFSGNSDLPNGAFIVTSLSGALDLATFLDHNPTLEVTHLLLSDSSANDLQTKLYSDEDTIQRHPALLDRIVSRAAPTIETFSYLLYQRRPSPIHTGEDTFTDARLFNNAFPHLRDLTLRMVTLWKEEECGPEPYEDPDIQPLPECIFPSLPSVSHLHLVTGYDLQLPSLTSLRESLPALSYLRLTATPLPAELRSWRAVDGSEQNSLPLNLTVLYNPDFHPFLDLDPDLMLCGNPAIEYDYRLEQLGEQCDRLGDSARLVWPSEEDYKKYSVWFGIYPVERAINDFKARLLEEGDGAWSVSEERPWAEPMEQWWWNRR